LIDCTIDGIPVIWSAKKSNLVIFRQVLSTSVAAANIAAVEIRPTAGHFGRILALGVYVAAITGATGNHYMHVTVGGSNVYAMERLYVSEVVGATGISLNPPTVASALKECMFSVANPLVLRYTNATDIVQSGSRAYYVSYEEVPTA
jgi:hypothetical protein